MKRYKYTIRLLPAAEEDFKEIILYIAVDNLSAAESMAIKIEKNLSMLSEYPLIGAIPGEEELANMVYRFLVVQNYLIFYTIEEKIIWIHRMIHGARDYIALL